MKYNILKDEIYRTSYLICEPLFLEEDWKEMKEECVFPPKRDEMIEYK